VRIIAEFGSICRDFAERDGTAPLRASGRATSPDPVGSRGMAENRRMNVYSAANPEEGCL